LFLSAAKGYFKDSLESPHLDFLQSPASYCLRDLGEGDTTSMIPLGSLRLAGKAWLRDFDTRTSITRAQHIFHPVGRLWRFPEDTWQDQQLLWRDAAYSIVKAGAWWWHEINQGMYSLPEHIGCVEKINRAANFALTVDRRTVPGCAVLIDPEGYFALSNASRLSYALTYQSRQLNWTHSGLSCETYCVKDVQSPDFPPHKLLLIPNAFRISEAEADAIIAYAKKNRAVVVWQMAPGVSRDGSIDMGRTSEIVGMAIKLVNIEAYPGIITCAADHALSEFCHPDELDQLEFGGGPSQNDDSSSGAVGPLFYVDVTEDDGVVVCGISKALGLPAFAYKKMGDWTSVFVGAPGIPPSLLRALGRMAGCHVFNATDDSLHVCTDLLLLNCKNPGKKEILFNKKADVVIDLFTGEEIGRNTSAIDINLQRFETLFCYYGKHNPSLKLLCRK